ncbi:FAD-dependent oxidoreductase [Mumia sp. ZJ1417]|uniref:FAD-dependent oxidoreductase n=1 Tax=Mumia sp. ZJ1417 TaxID=2708082 RepID=UPI001FB905C5|nr:FAD-dependent oxidoreductase [Mumia sp. ZJ1417]
MSAVEPRCTIVVGGVAAGMSAATRLRRNDEHRRVVVLERGAHVSFANCGLPYHVGGVIEKRDDLLLQTPTSLAARFGLDVRTRHEVVTIDRDRRTVVVRAFDEDREYEESYDELVLATGARAVRPPIPGAERAHTLRDLDDMDAILAVLDGSSVAVARSVVVVGAGFIGIELAENLTRRGLGVALVEREAQVLPPLDVEMAGLVDARLRAHGVDVRTSAGVARIDADEVVLDDGTRLAADLVVTAVGVVPESGLAERAGLAVGEGGGVEVDPQQRTSDPAIFAVGDVAVKRDALNGQATLVPLAQTANRQGRLVADVIAGRDVVAPPVLGTAVVGAFGMTAATVGWSEKRVRAAGRPVRVIHTHPSDHAGYYPGARAIALKLLVDPRTDAILGAQGVGEAGVDKRIDVIATAMRGGLRASDLADLELAYAPQYGSAKDPVNMLGMVADNLAAGFTDTVQWHEVDEVARSGATVIDVRTPEEYASGTLPDAVNVPLDELRHRHQELPEGRLVVTCAVGQRGHTATRLLRQLGREDVANLDGGYRTWKQAVGV